MSKPFTTVQTILLIIFGTALFTLVIGVLSTILVSPFVSFQCLGYQPNEDCEDDIYIVQNTVVVVSIILYMIILLNMYKKRFGSYNVNVMKVVKF